MATATAAAAIENTPAALPTRPAPLPLAEIAQRSDELSVYLKDLQEQRAPSPEIQAIDAQLPPIADRIQSLRTHTATAIAASPALREVDELADQWGALQSTLGGWTAALTARVTVLESDLQGLAGLEDIWTVTRDAAQRAAAPGPLLDRIKAAINAVRQTRAQIDAQRQQSLLLQDRVVQETARCRDALDQLDAYRRAAVGRLLIRDAQPIWAPERWSGTWDDAVARLRAPFVAGTDRLGEYLLVQAPRAPFQLALFLVLLLLWRRARERTGRWAADDSSLAPVAAVFEHPFSAALLLTLLATRWFYPQMPLLMRLAVRVASVPPLLRVLRRLVQRPLLPAVIALGVFFIVDQLRTLLAAAPLAEQALFAAEMLAAAALFGWLRRSGRIERLRGDLSARAVQLLDRAAVVLVVALTLALVAALLGFMQLARVIAGTVLGGAYAAILLFAVQRFARGVWAYALRTQLLRRAQVVQHHRALLQARGERVVGVVAAGLWVAALLANAELLVPVRTAARAALTATLSVGAFSVSLGNVLAFVLTIWLSFLFSRALRFVLAEDVYPRVHLPRGFPYALSTMLHYGVLTAGFFIALAAAGLDLDRFALLAGAFGVGVGFGLQNVVNNFVSGLILLFERPIQVGDTVQIGSVCGEVRRIGIRSSTVRTFEGAEVIVPNGTLIADSVTNWTLSDRMRRIDLPVSVAYGNDPEHVLHTLRTLAASQPAVVRTPAPNAIFVGFGDAALNFELRVWTDRFEQWVAIRSELALTVFQGLPRAGIALPTVPRELYRGSEAPEGGGAARSDNGGR